MVQKYNYSFSTFIRSINVYFVINLLKHIVKEKYNETSTTLRAKNQARDSSSMKSDKKYGLILE